MKKAIDPANWNPSCTYTYDRQCRVVSILADGIEKVPGGIFTRPSQPLSDEQWAKRREEIRAEWIEAMAKPDLGEGAQGT